MNIFEAGKFIQKKGLEIVALLSVAVVLAAGWIFYVYSWKAVESSEDGLSNVLLKEKQLDEVVSDLNERSANFEKLRQNRLSPRDIFR